MPYIGTQVAKKYITDRQLKDCMLNCV